MPPSRRLHSCSVQACCVAQGSWCAEAAASASAPIQAPGRLTAIWNPAVAAQNRSAPAPAQSVGKREIVDTAPLSFPKALIHISGSKMRTQRTLWIRVV